MPGLVKRIKTKKKLLYLGKKNTLILLLIKLDTRSLNIYIAVTLYNSYIWV